MGSNLSAGSLHHNDSSISLVRDVKIACSCFLVTAPDKSTSISARPFCLERVCSMRAKSSAISIDTGKVACRFVTLGGTGPDGSSLICCATIALLLNQAVAETAPLSIACFISSGALSRLMYLETKPFDLPILEAICSIVNPVSFLRSASSAASSRALTWSGPTNSPPKGCPPPADYRGITCRCCRRCPT